MATRAEMVAQGYREAQGIRGPYPTEEVYLQSWILPLTSAAGPEITPESYWHAQEVDAGKEALLRKAGQAFGAAAADFYQRFHQGHGFELVVQAMRQRTRELNGIYKRGFRPGSDYRMPDQPDVFVAEEVLASSTLVDPQRLQIALAEYSGDVTCPEFSIIRALAADRVPDPGCILDTLQENPPMCVREAIVVDALERGLATFAVDADDLERQRVWLSKNLRGQDTMARRVASWVKTVLRVWGPEVFDRCDEIPTLFPGLPEFPSGGRWWMNDQPGRLARLALYRATILAIHALRPIENDQITEAIEPIGREFPGFAQNHRDAIHGELARVTAEGVAYLLTRATISTDLDRYRGSAHPTSNVDLSAASALMDGLGPTAAQVVTEAISMVSGQGRPEGVPHSQSHNELGRHRALQNDLTHLHSLPPGALTPRDIKDAEDALKNWRRAHGDADLASGWLGRLQEVSAGTEWLESPRMRRILSRTTVAEKIHRTAWNHYVFRGVSFEELALDGIRTNLRDARLPGRLTSSAHTRLTRISTEGEFDWAKVDALELDDWAAAGADDAQAPGEPEGVPVKDLYRYALGEARDQAQKATIQRWFAVHYVLGSDPVTSAMRRLLGQMQATQKVEQTASDMVLKAAEGAAADDTAVGLTKRSGRRSRQSDPTAEAAVAHEELDSTASRGARRQPWFGSSLGGADVGGLIERLSQGDRNSLAELVDEFMQEPADWLWGELAALLVVPAAEHAHLQLPQEQLAQYRYRLEHEVDLRIRYAQNRIEDPVVELTVSWAEVLLARVALGSFTVLPASAALGEA